MYIEGNKNILNSPSETPASERGRRQTSAWVSQTTLIYSLWCSYLKSPHWFTPAFPFWGTVPVPQIRVLFHHSSLSVFSVPLSPKSFHFLLLSPLSGLVPLRPWKPGRTCFWCEDFQEAMGMTLLFLHWCKPGLTPLKSVAFCWCKCGVSKWRIKPTV